MQAVLNTGEHHVHVHEDNMYGHVLNYLYRLSTTPLKFPGKKNKD